MHYYDITPCKLVDIQRYLTNNLPYDMRMPLRMDVLWERLYVTCMLRGKRKEFCVSDFSDYRYWVDELLKDIKQWVSEEVEKLDFLKIEDDVEYYGIGDDTTFFYFNTFKKVNGLLFEKYIGNSNYLQSTVSQSTLQTMKFSPVIIQDGRLTGYELAFLLSLPDKFCSITRDKNGDLKLWSDVEVKKGESEWEYPILFEWRYMDITRKVGHLNFKRITWDASKPYRYR